MESRFNAHKAAIQGTFKTINEVRAEEEMDPVTGGDVLLQPTNFSEFPYDAKAAAAAKAPLPGQKVTEGQPVDGKDDGKVQTKPISGGENPPVNGKPVGVTAN